MTEATLMRQIQIEASKRGARLFRNNIGFCTCRGRKIRYGVGGKGFPDLIGWFPVLITPQMVGTIIAQFYGVEVKKDSGLSKQQLQAIITILRAGGRGRVSKSPDEI